MMQSCASAAKLRGSGPNLHSGFRSHGFTSGHRYLGFIGQSGHGPPSWLSCCAFLSMLPLMMPDVRRCHPTLGHS
jgi:hypothetical protein